MPIKKLKIFNGATPEVGKTATGFVLAAIESPFTKNSFVQTAPIDSISMSDGIATTIIAGEATYELERVDRRVWMQLMTRLDEFRQPVKNVYQPD